MNRFDYKFGAPVCGIDEVGRGPLAGPVVSACVHITKENLNNSLWEQITDSKKLSTAKREKLFEPIKALCSFGIAEATVQEIDHLNIHHATLLAMKRAYDVMVSSASSLSLKGGEGFLALIDGKFSPALPCRTLPVIKGDSLSLSIGAASILAKVTRDRLMVKLHEAHPFYGWDRNAGYGTKIHLEGLKNHGLTPHHRLSYAPCAMIQDRKSL